MNKEQKVTAKDLPIQKGKVDIEYIEVDGKKINLTPMPHRAIENYLTHTDCQECGSEFKKQYTYEKICMSCQWKKESVKYNSLQLVEWDVETPLCLFDDDKYFFHVDEILDYCYENEMLPSGLKPVTCTTSNFSPIDFDHWCDEVHEDWEPSAEFKKRLKEFNEFLVNESTSTWFASNKRVDLSFLNEHMKDYSN